MNISWHIFATADVSWALDPRSSVALVVVPDPARAALDVTSGRPAPLRLRPQDSALIGSLGGEPTMAFYLGSGVVFIIAGLFMAHSGYGGWRGGSTGMFILMNVGLLAVMTGLLSVMMSARNRLAMSALGEVELHLPEVSLPGEEVMCSVRFKPKRRVSIRRATFKIIGKEVVISTSGSATKDMCYSHVWFEQEGELCGRRAMQAGQPVVLTGTLRLPDDAPLSVHMKHNVMSWGLHLRFDVAWWPDWTRFERLKVVPYRADSPVSPPPGERSSDETSVGAW